MRLSFLSSRISLAGFLLGLAVSLTAILGVRLGYFDLAFGLELMLPAIAIGAVGFVAGAIWLGHALKINDSKGWRYGAVGFFGSLLILIPPANEEIRRLAHPALVDITTDSGTPPQFVALLPLRAGAENGPEYDGSRKIFYDGKETAAMTVEKQEYDLRPYRPLLPHANSPAKVVFWRAFEGAKHMGWHIVAYDEKAGTIEATDTSLFFGMVDDIAVRVRPAGRLGARLDIRSKSRMGDADGGSNAARIKSYIQYLQTLTGG